MKYLALLLIIPLCGCASIKKTQHKVISITEKYGMSASFDRAGSKFEFKLGFKIYF